MKPKSQDEKIKELQGILAEYEQRLARMMLGYRGVVHESAASELKHSEVMVLKSMVKNLKVEIANLKKD